MTLHLPKLGMTVSLLKSEGREEGVGEVSVGIQQSLNKTITNEQ